MRKGTGKADGQRSWLGGVVVLSLGWLLLYATRTALASGLKEIGDFWGLSESYLGFLTSSFFLSYTLLQIPSGLLADRFGSRRILMVGFAVQALGLFLGALSQSHLQFLASRILTGAGQATYFACQQAIVSFTVPPERRLAGTAATVAGAGLGGAAGFLVGRFLSAGSFGWKMPFVVLGGISSAYILAVLVVVPEPREGMTGNGASRQPTPSGETSSSSLQETGPGRGPCRGFLLFLSIAHFLSMYGFYLMLTWLPYYLETVRGLKGGLSAVIPVVMPLIMAPATIAWGMAADRRGSKEFVLWIALPVAAIATASVPVMRTPALLAAALGVYGATGKLVIDPALVAAVGENSPSETRSATLAVFNFAGALAMVIAPAVTGFIAQATGSFDVSFYAAGALNLVSLAAFLQGMRVLRNTRHPAFADTDTFLTNA